MKKTILSLIIVILLSGCSIKVKTINKGKQLDASLTSTALSKYANQNFWNHFHQGNYDKLDSILFLLSAAYNENPNDLINTAHLGFAHIWKLSERQRLEAANPQIIDHATLALKYFGEAYQLNPKDPRILGFLADMKMTVGSISDDKKLRKQGYFDGKKSIKMWKQFNYFTVAYVLSQLPENSWQFKKGLEWQWKTMDKCYCEKVDRENPDLKPYLHLEASEDDPLRKRTCWNTWIAPHNAEGFFLNMGDMLVKSGDWQKGIKVYGLAKQIPQYKSWPFKEVLENRIQNAAQNVAIFRKPIDHQKQYDISETMLIHSSIACMSCHQMSETDQLQYKKFDSDKYLDKHIYFLK